MNSQIPYPANSILNNPINFQQGNFPGRLDIQVSPSLQQFLPFIATACIEAIQSRYQENGLRVFLFNQMIQNTYNNLEFYALVKLTAQYVEMGIAKGMYRDMQSAIPDSAAKMVEITCVNNLKVYPALANNIDPVLYQRTQAGMNILDQTMRDLQMFYNNNNSFNPPQQQQYPQQQSYPQQQPQWPQQQPQNNYPSAPPSPYQQNFQQQPNAFYNQSNPAQVIQQQPNSSPSFGGSYLIKPELPVTAPLKPVQSSAFNFNPLPVSDELSSIDNDWIPSEKYPHNVVYNGETHELYYQKESSLEFRPFTKKLIGDKLMERMKHFSSTAVDTSSIIDDQVSRSKRSENLDNGITRKNIISKQLDVDAALAEIKTEDKVELVSIVERNIVGIGDEEIWKFCDIFLLSNREQYGKTVAYGSCAMVNDPLITNLSPIALADRLLNSDDFIIAQNILKNAKASALNINANLDELTIVNFFNKRITDRLNRYVLQQLGLNLTCDSFIDEGSQLIDHIEKKFQEKFSNPLRLAQKKIIYDACNYAEDGYHDSLVDLFVPKEVISVDKIKFFFNLDYFISINCFSWDLKFTLPSLNYSSAIFEDNAPILYKLASLIFEEADAYSNDFNRCLIRTLDRTVYSLTRSVIDSKTFLIVKVD